MNIEDYIYRINFKGDLSPNLKLLKQLQKLHLLNIPFENLDIHYGKRIVLDLDKIYQKVISKGRGGFCYELNGLFDMLLRAIGFDSRIISANVYDNKSEEFGPAFDHLAILVNIDKTEYLIDVGFGEFTFYPLKFELNKIQTDPRGDFVIEKYDATNFKVSKIEGDLKSIEYIFSIQEKALLEFAEMCLYHQTSPNSHFTQKKLISKPTARGRITLSENTLKITEHGITVKRIEFPESEYAKHLLQRFDIVETELNSNN